MVDAWSLGSLTILQDWINKLVNNVKTIKKSEVFIQGNTLGDFT